MGKWYCASGKWTAASPDCKFDYDNKAIYLTAEDCQGGYSVQQTVQNVVLSYYPESCGCVAGSSCAGGKLCLATSYLVPTSADKTELRSTYLCRAAD
jgi:hypothetical protein